MKKNILYYASIFLSVADIGGAVWAGWNLLSVFLHTKRQNPFGSPGFSTSTWSAGSTWLIALYIAVLVICIALCFPLEMWRRKLRDEAEYDENGISRKFGDFSKLSASERKRIEEQKLMDAERILDTPTLKRMTHKGETDPETALKKLTGLNDVKKSMDEAAARMQYEATERKKDKRRQMEGMHMCFMGPPGTGKTTCAGIMTGYLYKYGYIKKNQYIETDGNFLKGETPGESSRKTRMLIDKAIGGVLFIDEAYALLQKNGNTYGQESIATIVKAMEDHRNDIVFIFAGYEKEMKELVNSNPGLESRIKYYMWFGDYTAEDLKDIFLSMSNQKGFCVSAEMMAEFDTRIRYEMKRPNFGNARTVRTLLEKIIDRHALNLAEHTDMEYERYILTGYDMPEIPAQKHI